jgi:hypothetical protein
MSWSPNVADLPVTGEKPISSQKWKNVVYDIYNKLNVIRLLNTGVVAPVDAETGMPWVDTSNGITLKLYNALDLQWHALAFYSDLLASNVVVTPSGNLSASDVQAAVIELQADIDTRLLSADVATEATANKVLRLNADSKLPASITGDADTVDGKHAAAFQEVSQKDQPGGYVGLDNKGALNSKIKSTYISDFNTATIGGLYYWGSLTLNAPVPGAGGTALVIDCLHNAGLTQIVSEWSLTLLYIRRSTNTSNTEWTDWKKIDAATWGRISGTLSDQTDLQAALDGKQSVSEKGQPNGYAGLDTNGKINSEWIKDASESDKGVVKVGSNISVAGGVISVPEATEAVKGVVELATPADVLAGTDIEKAVTPAGFKAALASPAMTGSATLNGTTDNTVQLTDIVTTLGLEVGDVMRIQYSGYDKLHTVESITDANSIIVNYEHAGNRSNGSLRLADETATVTITRIAKWYNAPIGLGQAWVDVLSQRPINTTYTNTAGRSIAINVAKQGGATVGLLYVDGVTVGKTTGLKQVGFVSAIVPPGITYRYEGDCHLWTELR